MRTTEEFYVGYLPNAPKSTARFINWIILGLIAGVSITGFLLVKNQKEFSSGSFERNQVTEITGIIFHDPVPNIKVVQGKDAQDNRILISIPLIGYGKHGATGIISNWEKKHATQLDNKMVTIHGRLIYNDGKTLMEINNEENMMVTVRNVKVDEMISSRVTDLGTVKVRGEIIDPKCYFGVMKPGEGKPHRDCAIRCIAGGMPPTLEVKNEKGDANYILLLGENGKSINNEVQPFIAEPVEATGKLVQMDDWLVMYVNPENGIDELGFRNKVAAEATMKCESGCKMR